MNFDFKNKYNILLVISIVSIAVMLFLPFVSAFGIGVSLIKAMSLGIFGFIDIVGLAAAAGLIVGAVMKNKLIALVCSIVAIAYLVISMLQAGIAFAGIGLWIALIGYIASLIVTVKVED